MLSQKYIFRMKKKLFHILIITGFTLFFLSSCKNPSNLEDSPESPSPYAAAGEVLVTSHDVTDSDNFSTKFYGNSEGTFVPNPDLSQRASVTGNGILQIPELLVRYPENTFVSRKDYGFSSFKLVTDVFLKTSEWFNGSRSRSVLIRWGGNPDDLSTYIDLVSGKIVTDTDDAELYKLNYPSLVFQIDAPAATIIPDFEGDDFEKTDFSWTEIKPFFSTNSSAQHVVMSSLIDKPFVKWVSGTMPSWFSDLTTVQEFKALKEADLKDFSDWAINAPINQEFFDALENLEFTEDPCSGEAWLFLPMTSSIDLRNHDKVSFSFEFFLKDLFEVYLDAENNPVFVMAAGKTYTDQSGRRHCSPLPIRISYSENIDGFPVDTP